MADINLYKNIENTVQPRSKVLGTVQQNTVGGKSLKDQVDNWYSQDDLYRQHVNMPDTRNLSDISGTVVGWDRLDMRTNTEIHKDYVLKAQQLRMRENQETSAYTASDAFEDDIEHSGVIRVHIPNVNYKKQKIPMNLDEAAYTVAIGSFEPQEREVFTAQGLDLYVNIENKTLSEINEFVSELKQGYEDRNFYTYPHLPIVSTPEEPVTIVNPGLMMEIVPNKNNTRAKYKLNPRLGAAIRMGAKFADTAHDVVSLSAAALQSPVWAVEKLAVHGNNILRALSSKDITITRPGDPFSVVGAVTSRIAAWDDMTYAEARRPDLKGNYWNNEKFLEYNRQITTMNSRMKESISDNLETAVQITFGTIFGLGGVNLSKDITTALKYKPSQLIGEKLEKWVATTLKEEQQGYYAFTADDWFHFFSTGDVGWLEKLIPDIVIARGTTKLLDNVVLPIFNLGPKKAKQLVDAVRGDRVPTENMQKVLSWAKENGKSWKSGKDLFIEEQKKIARRKSTDKRKGKKKETLEEQWNKMHPAEKSSYLNRSAARYVDLKLQKDGGWFKQLKYLVYQNRFEAGASIPAYLQKTRFADGASAVGGTLAQTLFGDEYYLLGALPAAVTNPNLFNSALLNRGRNARFVGGPISWISKPIKKGTAGVLGLATAAVELRAGSAIDAIYATFWNVTGKGNTPLTDRKLRAATQAVLKKYPHLKNKPNELMDAVYLDSGMVSPGSQFVLPEFNYIDKNGVEQLAVRGSKEHTIVEEVAKNLNKITDPRSRETLANQLKYFLDMQNKLHEYAAKYPMAGVDPKDHPLVKLSGAFYEALPLMSTRALMEQEAAQSTLSVMGKLKIGEVDQIFLERKDTADRLGQFLDDAMGFINKNNLQEEFGPIVKNLGLFIENEQALSTGMTTYLKQIEYVYEAALGGNIFKPYASRADINNIPIDLISANILNSALKSPEERVKELRRATVILRNRVKKISNHIQGNKKLWDTDSVERERAFYKLVDLKNKRIKIDSDATYAPFQKAMNEDVAGNDVDAFFINTIDKLKEDRHDFTSIFSGAGIDSRHAHGAYLMFQDSVKNPARQIRENIMRRFPMEEGEDMLSWTARIDDLLEMDGALKNDLDLYYLVKTDNEFSKFGKNVQMGLKSKDIVRVDQELNGVISEIKNKLKVETDQNIKNKLSDKLDKYLAMRGRGDGSQTGSLQNLILTKGGAVAFDRYLKSSNIYATHIAPARWGAFNRRFEQINRINKEFKDQDGDVINYRTTNIDYKKSYQETLREIGKDIIEDPNNAWDYISRKFGKPIEITDANGEKYITWAIVQADDKAAVAVMMNDAIDAYIDSTMEAGISALVKKYGTNINLDEIVDDDLYKQVNNMFMDLAHGGKIRNAIETFQSRSTLPKDFKIWTGEFNPNGSFKMDDPSNFAYSVDDMGKTVKTLNTMTGKRMYDYEDAFNVYGQNRIKSIVERNSKAREAYTDFLRQKNRWQRWLKKEGTNKEEALKRNHEAMITFVKNSAGLTQGATAKQVFNNIDKAGEYLVEGGVDRVKEFERILTNAIYKDSSGRRRYVVNSELVGKVKKSKEADKLKRQRNKSARLYIANLIDYKFNNDIFIPMKDDYRVAPDALTGELTKVQNRYPDLDAITAAQNKYGSILNEYVDPEWLEAKIKIAQIQSGKRAALKTTTAEGTKWGMLDAVRRYTTDSYLSRGWGLTRGVIGWRWVGSEFAFREARASNAGLYRTMLSTGVALKGDGDKKALNSIQAMLKVIENGNLSKQNSDWIIKNLPEIMANSQVDLSSYVDFVPGVTSIVPDSIERKDYKPRGSFTEKGFENDYMINIDEQMFNILRGE